MNLTKLFKTFDEQIQFARTLATNSVVSPTWFDPVIPYKHLALFMSYSSGYIESDIYKRHPDKAYEMMSAMAFFNEKFFDTCCRYSIGIDDRIYGIGFINDINNTGYEKIDTISYTINTECVLELNDIPAAVGASMLTMFVDTLLLLVDHYLLGTEAGDAMMVEIIPEATKELIAGYNNGYKQGRRSYIKKFSVIDGGKKDVKSDGDRRDQDSE